MKVTKHIKDSINKSAKYRAMANEHNEKVRKWLESKGIYDNLGVEDCLVDSLEMSCNPRAIINYIENEEWNLK